MSNWPNVQQSLFTGMSESVCTRVITPEKNMSVVVCRNNGSKTLSLEWFRFHTKNMFLNSFRLYLKGSLWNFKLNPFMSHMIRIVQLGTHCVDSTWNHWNMRGFQVLDEIPVRTVVKPSRHLSNLSSVLRRTVWRFFVCIVIKDPTMGQNGSPSQEPYIVLVSTFIPKSLARKGAIERGGKKMERFWRVEVLLVEHGV